MSQNRTILTVLESTPNLMRLSLSLSWTYFTLGWRVRKTRKAFEKQMIANGMSKENAQQLSALYNDLKNDITAAVKQGIVSSGFR
jgi:hypothetical protein